MRCSKKVTTYFNSTCISFLKNFHDWELESVELYLKRTQKVVDLRNYENRLVVLKGNFFIQSLKGSLELITEGPFLPNRFTALRHTQN